MATIDFEGSLKILHDLNATTWKGQPLVNSFFFDSYNVWQTFQAKLFVIVQYQNPKEAPPSPSPQKLTFKFALAGMLAICISLLAYAVVIIGRRRVLVYSMDKA